MNLLVFIHFINPKMMKEIGHLQELIHQQQALGLTPTIQREMEKGILHLRKLLVLELVTEYVAS